MKELLTFIYGIMLFAIGSISAIESLQDFGWNWKLLLLAGGLYMGVLGLGKMDKATL